MMQVFLILLRSCVVCITLISIVHSENGKIETLTDNIEPVCNTTECQEIGNLYRQNMNLNSQPCTDFYDYVCHNWGIHQPKPKELNPAVLWDMHENLNYRALQDVKNLLEGITTFASKDFEQAKLLYRMCMDTPTFPRIPADDIRIIMKKIAEFPFLLPNGAELSSHSSLWEIHQRYLELTGESPFFDSKIGFHPLSPSEIITSLEALRSPYGAISHTPGWSKPDELKHYKAFLTDVIRNLADKNHAFSKQLVDDIKDVIEFRDTLNRNRVMQKFGHRENRIVTIKEFQKWYNAETKTDTMDVKWLDVIRAMYKKSFNSKPDITEDSHIHVQFSYIVKLVALLGKTPKRVIVNHMHLYFAERHMEWNAQMQIDLQHSVTDVGVAATGAIRIGRIRWKHCVESIRMKHTLDEAYSSLHFPKQDKTKVQELFKISKILLRNMISQSSWLHYSSKRNSMDKVEQIKGLIGYLDSNDPRRDSRANSDDISSMKATTRYSYDLNEVFASAAYLQWPMFSPNVPDAINYGATVNVFGRELHHAFDRGGVQYDSRGSTSWWPPEMTREHNKRIKCFKERYEQLKTTEINKLTVPMPYHNILNNTVDEDMADAMGLKLAYTGFLHALKKNNGACSAVPHFEQFGCEKLFFIAFANTFCSSLSPRQEEAALLDGSPTLPRIRVNGAVANMKEFSEAFGCEINSPLNPSQRCDLWK